MGFVYFLIGGVAGFITGYFVMRNNPKYFDLNKLSKDALQRIKDKAEELLK